MADPWTEAWAEAEASVAPVMTYDTLEMQHPAFVEDGSQFAVRAVNGVDQDMEFTLEDSATIEGGETVTFKAIPIEVERPEFSQGQTPQAQLIIDGVADEVTQYLEQAVAMRADMVCIYRQYREDDLSEPCYGPIQFNLKQVQVNGTRVTGTLKIDDLANRRFPNKVYTFAEFPGLVQNG